LLQYKVTSLQSIDQVRNDLCLPAGEFGAGSYPSKLQRLQNKVLRTTDNLGRRTPSRDLQNMGCRLKKMKKMIGKKKGKIKKLKNIYKKTENIHIYS
jgi:hypothetical protein